MAAYCKAIETTPSFANAPHTLMKLPAHAWPKWMSQRIAVAVGDAQADIVEAQLAPLLGAFEIPDARTALEKGIAEALMGIEVGIEPPPATWTKAQTSVMLFPQPEANGDRDVTVGALRLMCKIDCFSLISHTTGSQISSNQMVEILDFVCDLSDLSVNLETRLIAHLRYRAKHPPQFDNVKDALQRFSRSERDVFYREVIKFANDGPRASAATADVVYNLRIVPSLRKPTVFADLGVAEVGRKTKVLTAPERSATIPVSITIDHQRVSQLMNETEDIKRQLATIFANDEAPPNPPCETPAQATNPVAQSQVAGLILKPALAILFAELLSAETVTSTEMQTLCQKHGVMIGVAIDAINDASIETYGTPAIANEGASFEIEQEFKEATNR